MKYYDYTAVQLHAAFVAAAHGEAAQLSVDISNLEEWLRRTMDTDDVIVVTARAAVDREVEQMRLERRACEMEIIQLNESAPDHIAELVRQHRSQGGKEVYR